MKTRHSIPVFFLVIFLAVLIPSSCSKKNPEEIKKQVSHFTLGTEAYKAGRYHESVRFYEKALEFEPDNPDIYLSLAIIYDDCLKAPYHEQRKQDKLKAIEYYEKFILKSSDTLKKTRAKEWASICRQELTAMDAKVPPEDLRTSDAIDKEKAFETLKNRIEEISEQYSSRLKIISDLQSRVDELAKSNEDLKTDISHSGSDSKSVPIIAWILAGILFIVVIALAYSLKTTPKITGEAHNPRLPEKSRITEEKIIGSYIWVESVHNRGMMVISKDEQGIFVETRAINTDAISAGRGKYSDNVLEAMLKDEGGEGAQMKFEFFEDGRAFIAWWEDELGHGSAVGLRNEFDEMVRPENREKSSNA